MLLSCESLWINGAVLSVQTDASPGCAELRIFTEEDAAEDVDVAVLLALHGVVTEV